MHHNPIKNIAILGSTGSIGCQTLDVCREYPDDLRPTVLIAGRNVERLATQAAQWRPTLAIIADTSLENELRQRLEGTGVEVQSGPNAICEAMGREDVDTVVTATVGYSGLAPTVAAIRAGKEIALANKETMVVAGDLVTRLLASSPSRIYPVDSEHSAIYQCLVGEEKKEVKRLIITASGGPFRTWEKERIHRATAAEALRHPNWSMGAKITVDSATMINKAFEIIEARWLFDIPAERIEALVHPQSIIHSMVEFADGSVKAQLGLPDMRGPIRYALFNARHPHTDGDTLDLAKIGTLTFETPDTGRFPGLGLARLALDKGGLTPCVINAANEVAVAAFLRDEIPLGDIYATIADVLAQFPYDIPQPSLDDYVACNDEARRIATQALSRQRSYTF